jgi:hypothetical protein
MNNSEKHVDSGEVLFYEHHAAAKSFKSVWTKLASTYGCMKIVLSRETLTLTPHWFAKWLIIPLCLDLNHRIPINNIKGTAKIRQWFSYGVVELSFVALDGENRRIWLYLKKYREFIDAVKAPNFQPFIRVPTL